MRSRAHFEHSRSGFYVTIVEADIILRTGGSCDLRKELSTPSQGLETISSLIFAIATVTSSVNISKIMINLTPTVEGSNARLRNGVANHQEDLSVEEDGGRGQLDEQVIIGTLPDDILLEIFGSYLDESDEHERWLTLAHVCQRWRRVVSASPRRLNLRLVCTGFTPPGIMLAEWPALPIHIERCDKTSSNRRTGWRMTVPEANNIIAALKHNNRVSKIKLKSDGNMLLRHSLTEMQEPFPILDYLDIWDRRKYSAWVPPVLPDSFLSGSAPLLVHLGLEGIHFPGLPKLLSSANHLVDIHLENISCIPPDVMVASLSATTHLQSLEIVFGTVTGRENRPPHPVTRTFFPALKFLRLDCIQDYVEDFVARLDAPSLERMEISVPIANLAAFFPDHINEIVEIQVFAFSELPQFISRINAFVISDQAQLFAHPGKAQLTVSQKTRTNDLAEAAEFSLTFRGWPETLFSALPPLHFKRVEINEDRFTMPLSDPQLDVESELRELSRRFTAATDLFLDPRAAVLVGTGLLVFAEERVAELFPALQNIFLVERLLIPPVDEGFLKFTTARRLAGLPVTVHNWDRE